MIGKLIAFPCRIVFIMACGVFAFGMVLIGVRFPFVALAVAGVVAWRRLRRGYGSDWSHGSAIIAGLPEIEQAGLLDGDGLILGRCLPERPSRRAAMLGLLSPLVGSEAACRMFLAAFFGTQWYADCMIRVRSYIHLLTCAPAGAGKGVAVLVPNLRSYRGNCVITDPKGELFKLTSEFRRKRFGHKIIRLDPFGVCGPGSDTLNPCDFISADADDFLDSCRDLASMLVVRGNNEHDPHWNEAAELNLTAFTAFTCGCEPDRTQRNLSTVRGIASSRPSYDTAVATMQQVDTCQGVIRRLGGLLTWFEGKEQASVLSTFQRHTAFLDSPAVARNIATSSFDPMILRKGKATVYLILPADRLVSLAPLQRMWIGIIMRVITRGAPTEKNPVLWLLDEMAHIGHMQAITDAVTLMRGMGMRIWFFFQSVEQLKLCFGEHAAAVLDNIGTQQYFGITSFDTSDAISKRIGDATIAIRSVSDSTSDSHPAGGSGSNGPAPGSHSTSHSVTSSDIARRLLKPEEILTLPDDVALIFHKNMPVITARLVKYFNAPEFCRGGSGRQRRLGLAAGVMAVFTLTASLLFTGFAASLPPPEPVRRSVVGSPAYRPQPYGNVRPLPHSGKTASPAYRPAVRPVPRRRSTNPHNLPSRSGFLIQIK
jgi:type IV secretion system protein VirD4